MADKLIIQLKNIIFFKLVIYILGIVLLGALIPKFQERLDRAKASRNKAGLFLNQATIRLDSIRDFGQKIAEVNLKYKDLVDASGRNDCGLRQNLVKNLDFLSRKYKLSQPIKADISILSDKSPISNRGSGVRLDFHQALLSFDIDSLELALELANAIYNLLPYGSEVMDMEVKKNQVLTPSFVEKLVSNAAPGLVHVSLDIRLREITYKQ